MQLDSKKHLEDIRRAGESIIRFSRDRTLQDYTDDALLRSAIDVKQRLPTPYLFPISSSRKEGWITMPFQKSEQGTIVERIVETICPVCRQTLKVDFDQKASIAAFEGGKVFAEFPHACAQWGDMTLWVEILVPLET